MSLRPAEIRDLQSVYEMICRLEDTALDFRVFEKIYAHQLKSENYSHFLYCVDGKILGLITLRYEYQLHHCERIAEVLELVVSNEAQGKGIGSRLFRRACRQAKEQNCRQIELSCNQKRTSAHKFYEKMGMKNTHFRFCMRL